MSDARFYVYEHWRPDRGECFYVGKGVGRRARQLYKSARNDYHLAIQAKLCRLGLKVEIKIAVGDLDEATAHSKEIELIAFWRAAGHKLVNLTDGGEGSSNPSEQTRALMRATKLGKKLTAEHKAKIAEKSREYASDPDYIARLSAAIGAAANTPRAKARASEHFKKLIRTPQHCARISAAMIGKKLSPEHAQKARFASFGRKQRPEEIERRRLANTGKKRSPEFCQQMRDLQNRPDIKSANAERMRKLNADPVFKEASRQLLIARNKARTGEKRLRNKTEKLQGNQ